MFGTNLHGPKNVPAIEVWLYTIIPRQTKMYHYSMFVGFIGVLTPTMGFIWNLQMNRR